MRGGSAKNQPFPAQDPDLDSQYTACEVCDAIFDANDAAGQPGGDQRPALCPQCLKESQR